MRLAWHGRINDADACRSHTFGTIILVIKATACDTDVLEAAQRIFKAVRVMRNVDVLHVMLLRSGGGVPDCGADGALLRAVVVRWIAVR